MRHLRELCVVLSCSAFSLVDDSTAQESIRPIERDGWVDKYLTRDGTDVWRFEGVADLVVRAEVTSREFDPVLELVRTDEKEEVVLASRDDEGGTSRFIFRLTVEGRHQVRVRGFEQKGGGNYRLRISRHMAQPLVEGQPVGSKFDEKGVAGFFFTAGVGTTLTFGARGPVRRWRYFAPDGRALRSWHHALTVPDEGECFALLDGTAEQPFECWFRLGEKVGMPAARSDGSVLSEQSARIFGFDGGDADFRMIEMTHELPVATRLIRLDAEKGGTRVRVVEHDYKGLPVTSKGGVFRSAFVIRGSGRYQFQVLSTATKGGAIAVWMRDPTRPVAGPAPIDGELDVGSAHFHGFAAQPGQFFRVDLASASFDGQLRLTDASGAELAGDDDGGVGLDARLGILIRRAGKYRVQVSSRGDGGGGRYELKVVEVPIPKIVMGDRRVGTVTQGSMSYWHLVGRRGQEFFISCKSEEVDVHLEVMGPKGIVLGRDADHGVGKDSLLSIRLPHDGVYTIGVGSTVGSGGYALRVLGG